MSNAARILAAAALSVIGYSAVQAAFAMPWDIDLYRQQSLRSSEIARAPVKGTVPAGRPPFTLTNDEAEKQLKNPQVLDRASMLRGRRLYAANCLTCHGASGDGKGPTGPLMQAPSLLQDFYRQYGDGKIYGVLINGGTNMPRYGYKFSDAERWDLVNYVRYLQGREIVGAPQ